MKALKIILASAGVLTVIWFLLPKETKFYRGFARQNLKNITVIAPTSEYGESQIHLEYTGNEIFDKDFLEVSYNGKAIKNIEVVAQAQSDGWFMFGYAEEVVKDLANDGYQVKVNNHTVIIPAEIVTEDILLSGRQMKLKITGFPDSPSSDKYTAAAVSLI